VYEASVIIPTRDRPEFLASAVETARRQDGVAVEVLVVDDGSREPVASRAGVRVIRNELPQGVARARNQGIAAATREWIAFLDDDDLWSPHKLATQLAAAALEGASWMYSAAVIVDEHRSALRSATTPPEPERLRAGLLARNVVPAGASSVVARSELLRSVGGFDERLAQLADWELWIRLAAVARPAVCPDVLVAYMQHQGNMHLQSSSIMEELEYVAAKHRALSEAAGIEFDRVGLRRWIAWGHRRAGDRRRAATVYLRCALAHRSPGDAARALATLLGERAMRGPSSPDGVAFRSPDWLERHA
jgi:glycosyltransferase involved in cell wall biosynthesis